MNLAASTHWYSLTWVEWAGLVGVVLTLLGLYLTWNQAREAKDAATAASESVDRTQRQLRANQLLLLVPQMRHVAGGLDDAVELGEPRLVRMHLENWRWSAAHIHGVLENEHQGDDDLLRALQESVVLAVTAISAILGGKGPVERACRQARESIADVCTRLASWAGQQSSQVASNDEEDRQ